MRRIYRRSSLTNRATIRIVRMELCRWDDVPERLWRGETNECADEFRIDHCSYFDRPGPDYEFVAYYFELVPTGAADSGGGEGSAT